MQRQSLRKYITRCINYKRHRHLNIHAINSTPQWLEMYTCCIQHRRSHNGSYIYVGVVICDVPTNPGWATTWNLESTQTKSYKSSASQRSSPCWSYHFTEMQLQIESVEHQDNERMYHQSTNLYHHHFKPVIEHFSIVYSAWNFIQQISMHHMFT